MSHRSVTVDTGGPDDVFIGSSVTWMHVPRGGYGFIVAIPATVLSFTAKGYVQIEVHTRSGRHVKRVVAPSSLRWEKP